MFESPQTLWNCMTLATLSILTRSHHTDPGHDSINETQVASANEVLNFGNLNTFDFPFALYRPCVLESCSDPRFGGCSPNVTEFLSHPVNTSRIRSFANVMSRDYCGFSDPGIDYDIAGPGVMIAYFFQFGLAFFFFFALKTTTSWVKSCAHKRLSGTAFAETIRRAIIDLQETQAAFLVTIAIAAIATFRGKEGTGLANIPTVVSWITNDTILRGIVAAGSYPLLLIQLALHAAGKRWLYTLLFVVVNLILVSIMHLPKDIDPSTLLPHFEDAAENLGSCGSHAGPMTFCQRFRQRNTVKNPITQPDLFFFITSRHPQFIYLISGCLVLDWTTVTILKRWNHQPRSDTIIRNLSFITPIYEVFWALLEVATFAMCVLSLVEIKAFWDVLRSIGEGPKSETNINNWGFGQLIAVAVWFPVILKLCCSLVCK
ncbi:hypothetical protein GCG54_00001408 [Colletotrichum gloeosporioides]|uniref:Uncharacterized protein n=1 Tax=Colletotrichum gloeosporioides TaxID=474922 RepID=A0A8H4C8Z2_COLGL|nr:uncharacterized protein GCG54_00001408 [Colletotrichum gloeosporioides]KAF3799366.1 hypothetical protein GCG54_00001408 [Colletotrichum gloeosporioides]